MKKSRRNFLKKSILGLSTIPSAGFISKSETFTSLNKIKNQLSNHKIYIDFRVTNLLQTTSKTGGVTKKVTNGCDYCIS